VTVQVWFHVITDGSLGNLTTQQINAQMAALNDGFAVHHGVHARSVASDA
jgi:hypothetical protein